MGENTKHRLTHGAVLAQAVLCHVAGRSQNKYQRLDAGISVGANPITGTKYAEASHGGAVVPRIPGSTVKGINSVRAGSIPAFGSPHHAHGCPSGLRRRPAKPLFASSNLVPCSNS